MAGVSKLLEGRKNIVVITGAGISVSSGIPDFRSKDIGIYETLDMEKLGLSCPEDLFDSHFFQEDPVPFYKFAKSIYFTNCDSNNESAKDRKRHRARPSDSHKLLVLLEQQKRLLRCYTQNIDGLEQEAGVSAKKIVYAHGSLEWATCLACKQKVARSEMEEDVLAGRVARCRSVLPDSTPKTTARPRERSSRKRSNPSQSEESDCIRTRGVTRKARTCNGVLKPGITFFGETLGENVRRALEIDHDKVDALIVIGTSLSCAHFKGDPLSAPDIPRILINRSIVHPPLPEILTDNQDEGDQEDEKDFREEYVFDAYLLGFCDDIIRVLVRSLFCEETNNVIKYKTEGELLSVVTSKKEDAKCDIHLIEDWKDVKIPHNRVFLFPGALAPLKSGNSDDVSTFSYREVAHCDGCSKRIEGIIRKCVSCFDYDLCTTCYPTFHKNHFKGKHVFASEAAAPPFPN